jgi:hypothetical protein
MPILLKVYDDSHILSPRLNFTPGNPPSNCLKEIDVDLNVASYNSTKKIRAQLPKCNAEHNKCRKANASALPSRVIDVGYGELSTTLKLHVPKHQEYGSYVA